MNLETETYETATVYDALNRPIKLTTPDNGVTKYTYDKGGLLKAVEVENVHSLDTDIVNNIEYDAKGQRTKIQYENGTTTSYEYDAFTFRIRRIRTTRHSDSKELQDLHYWYDSIGNITLQKDLAQQTVYFDGSVAEPHHDYTYDSLYRLIQTEGRELAGNNQAPNHNDSSRLGITPIPIANTDTAKMRRYIQYYEYDEVGNFISMQHTVTGGTGNWTRHYTTANNSNKLTSTIVGAGTPENYTYDNRGNIVSGFFHLQSLKYNAENRLEKIVIDGNRTAYYQYDYNGQRVRKVIIDINTNISEIRKYVGEWEIYRKFVSSSLTLERETLHISDDTGRIALIDTRTTGSGSEPTQLLRYQYSNYLQSAILELDDVGAIISYEEYYPYGSTSFQSGRSGAEVSLKRYRYTGKERDEESGLYYHGARYYVPWLARWTAVDPMEAKYAGMSPYNYAFNNPVIFNDPNGADPDKDEIIYYSEPNDEIVIIGFKDPQKRYEEGEKITRAMFQSKLEEVENSNADENFKKWFAEIGIEGLISFRNALFQSKIDAWQNFPLQKVYGRDPDDLTKAYLPENIRVQFWNEAIAETVPTLKSAWAAQQSGGSSIGYMHNRGLTVSSSEEGWDLVTEVGKQVARDWLLHFTTIGLNFLPKVGTKIIPEVANKGVLPNSGPIIKSLGAGSRAEMLAKKFKMNVNSPTTRQVLNSLDETVESFISKYRKSSIRSEIPGQYLNQTVEEALKSGNTTIRKLLTDGRFVK